MAKQKSKFMFPISPNEGAWEQELGMTKREHFASLAMQAMISNPKIQKPEYGSNLKSQYKKISNTAVQYADALIESLKD